MSETENTRSISIILLDYPEAMQSALSGLEEMFALANRLADEHALAHTRFSVQRCFPAELENRVDVDVVIAPPSLGGEYYLKPDKALLDGLLQQHQAGATLCSACAGAFILASTGLLDQRAATTHWQLADALLQQFPQVQLDIDPILINDGDLITAGGLMSWLDLGLELVEQFASTVLMIELGKMMVIDTGKREQRYYKTFRPRLNHGDQCIRKLQHHLQQTFAEAHSVEQMAEFCHLGSRTLLRRFVAATGYKPNEYLQNLRIQKARELAESSRLPFDQIALRVGYEDISGFRKVFRRITGLTPSEFRSRFAP